MLDLLQDPTLKEKEIYFYSSEDKKYRSNAAVLILAFQVLCLHQKPAEAFAPFRYSVSSFATFHDASFFPCPYVLTVKDCIDGLYKAEKLNFFTWPNFNADEYHYYCELENGDLNWIVDGKFLAFAGPFEQRKHFGNGYYSTEPSDLIPYFKEKQVSAVIRLNKPCYDRQHFVNAGINHYELFYPDGGNPPEHILKRFIEICEYEEGAIAVHCKAGLGRTGTCIGMYLMKHYKMTAKEVIGYFRVARPGSVIGPQQDFLEHHQNKMINAGKQFRKQQRRAKRAAEEKTETSPIMSPRTTSITSDTSSLSLGSDPVDLVMSNDVYVNMKANSLSGGSLDSTQVRSLAGSEEKDKLMRAESFGSVDTVGYQSGGVEFDGYDDKKSKLGLKPDDTQGDMLNKAKAQAKFNNRSTNTRSKSKQGTELSQIQF